MRWLAVLGLLFGCAPIDPEAQRALRQAFTAPPQLQGPDGGRLGQALAPCRTTGFVAGAPGVGSAMTHLGTSTMPAGPEALGLTVACDGPTGSLRILSGGLSGLKLIQVMGGGSTTLSNAPTVALSRAGSTTLPVLVGEAGGVVRFLHPSTFMPVAPGLMGVGPSFGAALTWFPSGARFAVATPESRQVDLYDFIPDAGAVHVMPSLINTGRTRFGMTVAVGDVSPRFGLEVIIGSEGAVDIYEQNGTLIQTLTGSSTSFGAALAVQNDWATGIDALWVGEPSLDRIHQFVGDAGTMDQFITPAVRFGASLSVDQFGELAIGAPEFPDPTQRGAVFTQQVRFVTPVGEVGDCDTAIGCLASNCMRGTCKGGVFCEGLFDACETGAMCDVSTGVDRCFLADGGVVVVSLPGRDAGNVGDAGAPDAGSPDAGSPDAAIPDAGTPDAGTPDAGAPDAGAPDAGTPDAGTPDAGTPDAGTPDAGPRDAGGEKERDGGSADAGDHEPWIFTSRSCSTSSVFPLVLISLALARRRRTRTG